MSPEQEEMDKHLHQCGPFCTHIEFCPDCVDVFGVCPAHRATGDFGRRWTEAETKVRAARASKDGGEG